ncbi:MAG: hypothetical protein LBB45_07570 [Methanobrevibacter sp.]|jgi:hypothetical protein|nr:hypothetical protein [Candidatus Methanovirga basalitermitum]
MSKKLFTKLLPISTIALLGGGIASSLTLTSCSKKEIRVDASNTEDYLVTHRQNGPDKEVEYDENGNIIDYSFPIYLLKHYTKQALINYMIYSTSLLSSVIGDYYFFVGSNTIILNFYINATPVKQVYKINKFSSIFDYKLTVTAYVNDTMTGSENSGCDINDFKINEMSHSASGFSISYNSIFELLIPFGSSPYDYQSITYIPSVE